jgi:8-oxo-dGTP diphosphatase
MSTATVQVVAAVVSRGDEFLICRRGPEKRYPGLWEFPGGKCEPGESIGIAAQRELREELCVNVIEVGTPDFSIHDPDSPFLIVFAPVKIIGEPQCREHLEFTWAKLTDLALLPLAPSDRSYVEFRLSPCSR